MPTFCDVAEFILGEFQTLQALDDIMSLDPETTLSSALRTIENKPAIMHEETIDTAQLLDEVVVPKTADKVYKLTLQSKQEKNKPSIVTVEKNEDKRGDAWLCRVCREEKIQEGDKTCPNCHTRIVWI